MQIQSAIKTLKIKHFSILIVFFFIFIFFNVKSQVRNCKYIVPLEQTNVDANSLSLLPGDTVCIMAGKRQYLRFANFRGDSLKYIVIKNYDGEVVIENDDHYFGLSISNCSYFRLTGSADNSENFGIKILKTFKGASGLTINNLSTNFEIDHLEIANTGFAGIMSFSQPKCDGSSNRGNFVQRNVSIHDNYIHHTLGEGLYIGHSFYTGYTVDCFDKPEILFPHEIKGLRVYNNVVDSSGWDGIQVGSANFDCEIYGNKITNYGIANEKSQNSGIQIGNGTTGKCYNNAILNGSGTGISLFGTGNNILYNNLIVNAGQMGDSIDLLRGGYGIFCDDRATSENMSYNFINNTIISPKTDGIRIYVDKSKNNKIINNLILNPGSYGLYKDLNQSYLYYKSDEQLFIVNNYFSQIISPTIDINNIPKITDFTFSLPIINKGADVSVFGINFDFNRNGRIKDNICDIGAFEFDSLTKAEVNNTKFKLYPNPNSGTFFVNNNNHDEIIKFSIKTINGLMLYENLPLKANSVFIELKDVLNKGIYTIDIETINDRVIKKFIIN
ncbi:MAG: right-handed parallel beta-helix repeat-containing protein [Paludibacter sp.]